MSGLAKPDLIALIAGMLTASDGNLNEEDAAHRAIRIIEAAEAAWAKQHSARSGEPRGNMVHDELTGGDQRWKAGH